jgi:hypothetical protein
VDRAEAEIKDLSALDSDEVICLGTIAKTQEPPQTAGRFKDHP